MGISATLLGMEINKSPREMNVLLKEQGYLYGTPGAYGLTEKGKHFGQEEDHHAGPGGYSWYNRDWTTTTWDKSVLDALANDIDSQQTASKQPAGPDGEDDVVEHDDYESSTSEADTTRTSTHRVTEASKTKTKTLPVDKIYFWVGAALVTIGVGIAAAPHAKRLWNDSVAPRTKRLWRKVTKSSPADAAADGDNTQEEAAETAGPEVSPDAHEQAPESERS